MATATIIGSGDITSGARKTGLTSASPAQNYIDPDNIRPTEYYVYLHTISRRTFNQPNSLYNNVAIPACPEGKRSFCFMKVGHPVPLYRLNPDDVNGVPTSYFENARRVALGICNLDYAGTDLSIQDKELNPESVMSSGECNLNRQGVFASMNEVPTEEEERKAEARREAYYKFRLNEADGLERSNPRQLQFILMLDHHMAADYFGIEANWHRAPSAKVDCPNCGEKIPKNAALHYLSNGRPCILDWEKAWLAGAVKKEDVPEPKRWWSDVPVVESDSLGKMSKDELKSLADSMEIAIDMRWSQERIASTIREAQLVAS